MSEKKIKNTMENVMKGLLEVADKERKSSDGYKDLFSKSRGEGEKAIRGLIYETERKMMEISLDCTTVFEQKTGKRMTNQQYYLILALPYLLSALTKDIEKKDGSACSVDKAYHLVYKQFLK